jgi:serine protease AprX
MTYSSTTVGGGRWQASVTVLVHTADHEAANGAPVTGTWSGGYSGTGTCTTRKAGQCKVSSGKMPASETSVTFTVDNIAHATLVYEPTVNDVPESLTVAKP